jgi:hypothetical protein
MSPAQRFSAGNADGHPFGQPGREDVAVRQAQDIGMQEGVYSVLSVSLGLTSSHVPPDL